MPKKITIKLDKKGISNILNDPEIIGRVEKEIGPQLTNLFESLYPGSKWETEIRQIKERKTVVVKTDTRDVPFREAATGRIRKTLRASVNTYRNKK